MVDGLGRHETGGTGLVNERVVEDGEQGIETYDQRPSSDGLRRTEAPATTSRR